MKTFHHSGNLGDIIWSLHCMKNLGGGNLHLHLENIPNVIRKYNNGPVYPEYEGRLSKKDYDMIAPLLEQQEYISKVSSDVLDTFDYDLDEFRGTVGQAFDCNFLETFAKTFNTEATYSPWLKVVPKKIAQFVVTRTSRFHSNKVTTVPQWKQFIIDNNLSTNGIFIGHEQEHKEFEELFAVSIPYYKINNFLEMAEVISGANCYVGNQTFAYSLAQGLGIHTVLETRSVDCYIEREGSYYF